MAPKDCPKAYSAKPGQGHQLTSVHEPEVHQSSFHKYNLEFEKRLRLLAKVQKDQSTK